MPIFPFIAGLAAGVIAVRLYKDEQFRAGVQSAGQKLRQKGTVAEDRLRQAAASGLEALADSSARLRDRLRHEEAAITLAAKPASGKRKPAARAAAESAKPVKPAVKPAAKPTAKSAASVSTKGRK
jgi:hypothetical protein